MTAAAPGARKARAKKVEWLVMGPAPWLATCNRCGDHVENPPMPASMEAVLAYINYAVLAHAGCREVAP